MTNGRTTIIKVEDLTVAYNRMPVLRNVNLTFKGPGLIQVIGPNGAGKTTLFKAILGLVKPVNGRVIFNGENVTGAPGRIGRLVGYLPQMPQISSLSPITAWELVYTSVILRKKISRREASKAVEKALSRVGIEKGLWYKRLWELSSGLRQRVFIARALAYEPLALILDEPLASVDPEARLGLSKLIRDLARDKLVIMSSHEPHLLLPYTNEIVLVKGGVVAFGEPADVMKKEILSLVYGEALVGDILVGEGGAHG